MGVAFPLSLGLSYSLSISYILSYVAVAEPEVVSGSGQCKASQSETYLIASTRHALT